MDAHRSNVPLAYEKAGAWTLEIIGAVLAGMGALLIVISPDPDATVLLFAETVVAVGFPSLLVYAGYWIGTHELSPADQWTVTRWTAGGIITAALFGQWILLRQGAMGGIIAEPVFFVLSCAAFGGVTGLGAGILVLSWHSVPALPSDDAESQVAPEENTDEKAPGPTVDRPSGVPDPVIADLADLLSDRRRLRIVDVLRNSENATVDFDVLVDHLAELEDVQSPNRREQIAVSLHHHHIPRLEEANIITYQEGAKRIRYTPSQYSRGTATGHRPGGWK